MHERLRPLRGFLLDLDGVLFRGDRAIPGAAALLQHLLRTSTPFCILTNNSTRTPEEYVHKLAGIGVAISPTHVLTSALVAASYLRRQQSADVEFVVVSRLGKIGNVMRIDPGEAGGLSPFLSPQMIQDCGCVEP